VGTATEELQRGDRVGPYVIESLLGEGGMGLVYHARDEAGREVALKLIRAKLARDERFRRRFEREAQAASQLVHDHVVSITAQGEHEGIPYIAQQFIGGGSLADLIEELGTLPLERTVRVCADAADGLEAVHAIGVIHRDVKPANIMLDEQGNAYINDFGLAKHQDASVLTKPGQAVGSLDYMAPEQIRGEDVGPPTDVYALGCVVYECLTGAPPFAARKGMQVLWAHLQDPPPDPAGVSDDIGEELSWTIRKALEKEPGERPPTPLAYARMLQVAADPR
jgi:serine/threonine-protein kinase